MSNYSCFNFFKRKRFTKSIYFFDRIKFILKFFYYIFKYFKRVVNLASKLKQDNLIPMANENRKIAGFFRQIFIILWKNSILFRRNKTGIICELIFSSLFTLIFLLLVYFANPDYRLKSFNKETSVLSDIINDDTDEFAKNTYYYYPNEEFVKNIMQNSIKLMKLADYGFNVKLIGTNISDAINFNDQEKKNILALISFPSNFTSDSLKQDSIEYSIYTTE